MALGFEYWYDGHAAFSSNPILKQHNYCYLVFYYILRDNGHTSLTVFMEESSGKKLTSLWSTDKTMRNWKKKVLELPQTTSNYSVVFLGYFGKYGGYVGIDDIEFKHCNSRKFIYIFCILILIFNMFIYLAVHKFAVIYLCSPSINVLCFSKLGRGHIAAESRGFVNLHGKVTLL